MGAQTLVDVTIDNVDEVLERMMKATGMKSQIALAKVLHVGNSTLSNWKARKRIPTAPLIYISQKFHVSYDWLLTGKEEAKKEPTLITKEDVLMYPWLQQVAMAVKTGNDKLVQHVLEYAVGCIQEKTKQGE